MNKAESKQVRRRTKIIATLGPATDNPQAMEKIIRAGVNVVRLNFSHGSHEEHQQRIDLVRATAKKQGVIIGIVADLQGPKIRVANFKQGAVNLVSGEKFILDAGMEEDGDVNAVGIDYKELPGDVSSGDILLLDDGRLTVKVDAVEGLQIHTTVQTGGKLSNHKGINRQGGGLSAKALTAKDKRDMEFACAADVDYIAISFPRDAVDMKEARELMQSFGGNSGLIAKIERLEAIDNLEEIIKASDGVMVARGDLAVEIGDAEVPAQQKRIIQRARALNVPVITATQMMESMIESTVPTRAEISDVANAVFDYTDAVMLSAESAVGRHPDVVIKAMARACEAAERHPQSSISKHRMECYFERVDESIAMASIYIANHLDMEAIIALTASGRTALWMSRLKTAIPIFALSQHARTLGKMTMCRGIYPIPFEFDKYSRDEINIEAVATTSAHNPLTKGQRVILTKGDQAGEGGGSNALKILEVGSIV